MGFVPPTGMTRGSGLPIAPDPPPTGGTGVVPPPTGGTGDAGGAKPNPNNPLGPVVDTAGRVGRIGLDLAMGNIGGAVQEFGSLLHLL